MKEQLVEKLFQGRCTEAELETLFQLIKQDPAPPDPAMMERLWDQVQDYPQLKEEVYQRVFSKILSKIGPVGKKVGADRFGRGTVQILKRSAQRRARIFSVAATILLLVIGGAYWMWQSNEKQVVKTAFGEWKTLELSDGSTVKLNANSQMAYKTDWGKADDRKIWLAGEAFFEVKKKPETGQKLQVITDDLTVEVLGTNFNVNSKGGKTSVFLEEGRIRLYFNERDTALLMEAGDLVEYSIQNHEINLKRKEIPKIHTSWKDRVLFFENSRLVEVLQKIEDIYGKKFQVTNPEDNYREVNFPLPLDQFEITIDILSKTLHGLEIRQEGNVYIVE